MKPRLINGLALVLQQIAGFVAEQILDLVEFAHLGSPDVGLLSGVFRNVRGASDHAQRGRCTEGPAPIASPNRTLAARRALVTSVATWQTQCLQVVLMVTLRNTLRQSLRRRIAAPGTR